MFDKELALEILVQIQTSINLILSRFKPIKSSDDFISSPNGLEKLDSICMQLIVIGESLKNLDKQTDNKLLDKYPEIEWKKVKGLRDIITHHYVDVNAEAIFDICANKINPLLSTINKIVIDIK
jgi:uncharacterized protein with HEPN domain